MKIKDWENQLDLEPENWELRLVYADWLNDHGYSRREACQRWMVQHRRRSYYYGHNQQIIKRQWSDDTHNKDQYLSHLPNHVFVAMRMIVFECSNENTAWFPNRRSAEAVLKLALVATGEIE